MEVTVRGMYGPSASGNGPCTPTLHSRENHAIEFQCEARAAEPNRLQIVAQRARASSSASLFQVRVRPVAHGPLQEAKASLQRVQLTSINLAELRLTLIAATPALVYGKVYGNYMCLSRPLRAGRTTTSKSQPALKLAPSTSIRCSHSTPASNTLPTS